MTGNRLEVSIVPSLYVNGESWVAARGYFTGREPAMTAAGKSKTFHELTAWSRVWIAVARPAVEARAYFAALAPAAAAKPSCWPVPPLAPIAPMILPFTIIGTPPSDATGFSGKVVNAVLPAAY